MLINEALDSTNIKGISTGDLGKELIQKATTTPINQTNRREITLFPESLKKGASEMVLTSTYQVKKRHRL
jgi:hypothetical protein